MPEVELLKVFTNLGIPGLALGVLYMLFRRFRWRPPQPTKKWGGPIILLFMLLISGIVFYTLKRWAPSPDVATIRVTVLGPDKMPVGSSKIRSSIGGETKKVDGGWELEIAESKLPNNRKIMIYAKQANLKGQSEIFVVIGKTTSVSIQLKRKPYDCQQGKTIWLYKYFGTNKNGSTETYDQLKGILFDKVSVLIEKYSNINEEFKDIETLFICMPETQLKSREQAKKILEADSQSIEIASGTLFFHNPIPIAKSRIYIYDSIKIRSFDITNTISAEEFSSIRDEFSIITLFALAQDAKRNYSPINVIIRYLSDAYMISKDLANKDFQLLISKELSIYKSGHSNINS